MNIYQDEEFSKFDILIKNKINEKMKNVRESLLLGEIKISKINPNRDDLNFNGVIVGNMLKEYKIKYTNEKIKKLVNLLYKLIF
jgi:hypothetical protein